MTIFEVLNIVSSIFRQYRDKKVLITTHSSADIDAFASVVVLSEFIQNFYTTSSVSPYFPSLSKFTQKFLEKLNLLYNLTEDNYSQKFPEASYDLTVIIDTNNLDQIEIPKHKKVQILENPLLVIDHHFSPKSSLGSKTTQVIYETYTSTSELIYELLKGLDHTFTQKQCILLACGILTDTGFLKYANNDTFFRISEILKNNIEIQEIYELLQIDEEISTKIAKIKGLQRVKLHRLKNEILFGIAKVGSFESKVATNLIISGFDLVIVYSHSKSGFNITGRVKQHLIFNTDLHLGELFHKVASELNISGGGHEAAASIKGEGDVRIILKRIVQHLESELSDNISYHISN